MKQLLAIAALLTSAAVFGQDPVKTETSTDFNRLVFGVNVSPDFCFRTLEDNAGSYTSSSIVDFREDFEGPKLGYTAGLNACYNFSKHWGIEAGLQYSNKGYASRINFGTPDPRQGINLPVAAKYIYNYHYLDVPVRAIFSFGEKRLHFVSSIGVTTNILLKATQTSIVEYENGDINRSRGDQSSDYKTLNISPTISAGVDYKICDKLNLRAEPTFRYGLLKIIDTPVTEYLWSGGLNISCYYSFK